MAAITHCLLKAHSVFHCCNYLWFKPIQWFMHIRIVA